jgi:hypothetical protein
MNKKTKDMVFHVLQNSNNSSLFDEFVCKLGLFWHVWAILKRVEYNVFGSTSPLKAPNCLKSLKLA